MKEHPSRTVAVKILHPGILSHTAIKRFKREAQALGMLQHSGIAQIIEAGQAEFAGATQHFVAMELISGDILSKHIARNTPSTRGRLELFLQICDAIEHAHSRRILHRDLKPGNIMVTAEGKVKVLDFGIARLTEANPELASFLTDTNELLGTLAYMSPEQVIGSSKETDVRADVYALGVILYELLANRLPLQLSEKPLSEAIRMVSEEEPARLVSINTTYQGDLDTIVAKALSKEPDRRYNSVAALADDVRRHLEDQPILARPTSTFYQLRKFARRNTGLVAGVVIAFFGLCLGLTAAIIEARAERQRAEELRQKNYMNQIARVQAELSRSNARVARQLLNDCDVDLRGWEWAYLNRLSDQSRLSFRAHKAAVTSLALSEDGTLLASGTETGEVSLWRVKDFDSKDGFTLDKTPLFSSNAHTDYVRALALSKANNMLVSCSVDQTVRIWDTATGSEKPVFEMHENELFSIALADRALQVISGDRSGRVLLWSAEMGDLIHVLNPAGAPARKVAFSANEKKAAACFGDGRIVIWDVQKGTVEHEINVGSATAKLIDLDSKLTRAFSLKEDQSLVLLDISGNRKTTVLEGVRAVPTALIISDDDRVVVCGTIAGELCAWDSQTGDPVNTLRGHGDSIGSIAIDTRHQRIITGARDGEIRFWNLHETGVHREIPAHYDDVRAVAASPDGSTFATAGDDDTCLWNASTTELVELFRDRPHEVFALVYHPDGRAIAAGYDDGAIVIWDVEGRKKLRDLDDVSAKVRALAYDPNGEHLALGCEDGLLKVVDASSSSELWRASTSQAIKSVAYSPRGNMLASAGDQGTIQLRAADSGRMLGSLSGHEGVVQSILFFDDGARILSAGDDGVIRVFNTSTHQQEHELEGHQAGVNSLALTENEKRLISVSDDGTVRLWSLDYYQEVLTLDQSPNRLLYVAYNDELRQIVAGAGSGKVFLWEADSLSETALAQRFKAASVRTLVDKRFGALASCNDVVSDLLYDAQLSEQIRTGAIQLARRKGDNSSRLRKLSWHAMEFPNPGREVCDLALRRAETAYQASGQHPSMLTTLGLAQYRAAVHGLCTYEDAFKSLKSAVNQGNSPVGRTFLAMTLHQLGRTEDARKHLQLLSREFEEHQYDTQDHLNRFLKEAELVILGESLTIY